MKNLLKPALEKSRLTDIDASELKHRGIEALIVDLDNTLLPWHSDEIDAATIGWLGTVRESGLRLCILTNNKRRRTEQISRLIGIRGIWSASKPFPFGFTRALFHLKVKRKRCAVVGDQLLTDILGGNMAGLFTILVNPLAVKELRWTQFVRKIEKRVLRRKLEYHELGGREKP